VDRFDVANLLFVIVGYLVSAWLISKGALKPIVAGIFLFLLISCHTIWFILYKLERRGFK